MTKLEVSASVCLYIFLGFMVMVYAIDPEEKKRSNLEKILIVLLPIQTLIVYFFFYSLSALEKLLAIAKEIKEGERKSKVYTWLTKR